MKHQHLMNNLTVLASSLADIEADIKHNIKELEENFNRLQKAYEAECNLSEQLKKQVVKKKDILVMPEEEQEYGNGIEDRLFLRFKDFDFSKVKDSEYMTISQFDLLFPSTNNHSTRYRSIQRVLEYHGINVYKKPNTKYVPIILLQAWEEEYNSPVQIKKQHDKTIAKIIKPKVEIVAHTHRQFKWDAFQKLKTEIDFRNTNDYWVPRNYFDRYYADKLDQYFFTKGRGLARSIWSDDKYFGKEAVKANVKASAVGSTHKFPEPLLKEVYDYLLNLKLSGKA